MPARPRLRAMALWTAVLAVSYALYRHEAALEHFAWHLGYGGAAGLLAATAWDRFTKRSAGPGHLWFLGGYLYMAIPDVLWLAPALVGNPPYPHAPWMDLFLAHYSLDLWSLATPLLVPTVVVAALTYVLSDEHRRSKARAILQLP